jgi:hypothetical protein
MTRNVGLMNKFEYIMLLFRLDDNTTSIDPRSKGGNQPSDHDRSNILELVQPGSSPQTKVDLIYQNNSHWTLGGFQWGPIQDLKHVKGAETGRS